MICGFRSTSEEGVVSALAMDGSGAVPTRVGRFLQRIVREIKPQTILEVGLAHGVSTRFIRESSPESRYIVIDPAQHSHFQGIGLTRLREAGYEVEFYEEESQVALPRFYAQG